MKALFCYSHDKFCLQEVEVPAIGPSEMLIEMLLCGLCGSDIIKIFDPDSPKPAIYGHEVVGKVVKKGKQVSRFSIGDVVVAAHHIPCFKCHYCRHGNYSMCSQFRQTNIEPGGFSQYIKLSGHHINYTTFKLPPGLPVENAVFIEPLACCMRAMDRVDIQPGDWVSVVGAGAIGILFIQLVKLAKAKAIAVDIDGRRLKLAQEAGADALINPNGEDMGKKIKHLTKIGADVVLLTVTNSSTVKQAMDYIRDGAVINIFGASQKNVTVDMNLEEIYKREITLKSTYSSTPQTLESAYQLISQGRIDVSGLLSETMPLSQFKQGLDLMLSRQVYKPIFCLK